MATKKLSAYQQRLLERAAQPGYWIDWPGVMGWRGRPVTGYLHWFKEGRKWPEYEAIPGPTLAKLRDLGIIEPGIPEGDKMPEFFHTHSWRLALSKPLKE